MAVIVVVGYVSIFEYIKKYFTICQEVFYNTSRSIYKYVKKYLSLCQEVFVNMSRSILQYIKKYF